MDAGEEFSYADIFRPQRQSAVTADKRSSKKKQKSSGSFFLNRLGFCLIAQIALWTSSLRNSTLIASNYISAPTFSSVYDSCSAAHSAVLEERSKYEWCVRRQLASCFVDFNVSVTKENQRVSNSRLHNAGLLSQLTTQLRNCSDAIDASTHILQSWNSETFTRSIPYRQNCSQPQRNRVQSSIGEDHSSSIKATSAANAYTDVFGARVTTLATYANDLSSYNYQYLHNKTAFLHALSLEQIDVTFSQNLPTVDASMAPIYDLANDIIACMSLDESTINSCSYGDSIYNEYIIAQRRLQSQIDNIFVALRQYQQVVNGYVSDVQLAMLNANRFYQSIMGGQGIIRWLIDTAKIIYSMGDLCGKSTPNFCTFSTDDWLVVTPTWPSIPTTIDFPDPSAIVKQMDGYMSSISPRITAVAVDLREEMVSLQAQLHVSLDGIHWVPDDYDPPRYPTQNSTEDEITAQKYDSQSYLSELKNILYNSTTTTSDSTSSLWSQLPSLSGSLPVNNSWIQAKSQTLQSWVTRRSHSWSMGTMNYAWIVGSFFSLQGILFLFDYLYRGVQSIRLFIRFWSRSVVKLPTIKAIEEEESALFNTMSSSVQCLHLFFRLLPLIWVQVLILLAMVVATIFVISALIVPEYHSYCHACVHHSTNETFLTELTNSAAFNLAAAHGNTRWSTGIAYYNAQTIAACEQGLATTQKSYLQSLDSLRSLNHSYAAHIDSSHLLLTCIDIPLLDAQIASSCCVEGDCTRRNMSTSSRCPVYLQTLSSHSIITAELWQPNQCRPEFVYYTNASNNYIKESAVEWSNGLGQQTQSAMFDCSALPQCHLTCDGPNEVLLQRRSKDCMCRMEWFWNAHLLQGVLVVVIFLLLNISRDLCFSGLLRVWWARFLPPVVPVEIDVPIQKSRRKRNHHHKNRAVTLQNSQATIPPDEPPVVHDIEQPLGDDNKTYDGEDEGNDSFDELDTEKISLDSTVVGDNSVTFTDANDSLQQEPAIAAKSHPSIQSSDHPQLLEIFEKRTKLIQDKIRWKLFWFVFVGYVKIVVGLAINILWYEFAVSIQRNIEYDGVPYPLQK